MAIAPLLRVQLRRPFGAQVVATDASSYAAGVVATASTAVLHSCLWPLGTNRCPSLLNQQLHEPPSSLDLSSMIGAVSPALQLQQPSVLFRSDILVETHSSSGHIATLLAAAPWGTIISAHWQRQEHINLLELHSILLAVRWALSRPQHLDTRLLLLTDSAVVFYGLRKGRSSAPALLSLYRRYAALVLGSGLAILPIWIPSAANPADSASRNVSTGPSTAYV